MELYLQQNYKLQIFPNFKPKMLIDDPFLFCLNVETCKLEDT